MKYKIVLFISLCELAFSTILTDSNSLVVSSTEPTKEAGNGTDPDVSSPVNPQIYSMQIYANITNRFARTLITSKVRNLKDKAEETTFSVILPENAFISEFEMEINDKIYKAYVKEKEEAKKIYEQAVSSGQSAAHVELSARDSKTFTVSVNIEPESKTIFRLVYEELLQREVGQYELIINIHPGQTVEDLGVQVHINESRPLRFVRSPSLRTGNEISKNDEKLDPEAEIKIINSTSATVQFSPNVNQQKEFGKNLGGQKENGLAGQFVVQYDVERDPQGGEVLVRDGYFVHFFAPSELEPLPKHVVFVLDHSGSMSGRKIDQLIEAMQNILSELKTKDLFNIVRFADDASVWNITENKFDTVPLNSPQYGQLEPHLKESNLPDAVQASKENVEKAKNVVQDKSDMGLTNIIAGLEIGLFLVKRTQENTPAKYQPMIIFLTDGLPNVGIHSGDQITDTVTKLNSGTNRAAIFSLSFGQYADKAFLRKLSSQNLGFSRHIYEAADASLQLQDFYSKISSPLLSNIKFQYVDGVSDVTKTHYPIFFNGSELVIAGRTGANSDNLPHVIAICTTGPVTFNTSRIEPVSSLERLWAYLTVKEILKQRETATNSTELTKKALDLALKYSFVTSVSSLVVVKPNQTNSVDSNPAIPKVSEADSSLRSSLAFGAPGLPGVGYSPPQSPQSGQRFYNMAYPQAYPLNANIGLKGSVYQPPPRPSGPVYHSLPAPRGPAYYQPPRPLWIPTTRRTPLLSTSTTSSPPGNSNIPQWLQSLKTNNENITTAQGSFKLGHSGDVTPGPACPKTPGNGTIGVCTLIFDCPEVFSLLPDINVYLQYFCPLNEYAGVCCPVKSTTVVIP